MAQRIHTLLITGLTLMALLLSSVSASAPLMSLKMLSMQSMNTMSHDTSSEKEVTGCSGSMMHTADGAMVHSSSPTVMDSCHSGSGMDHDVCCSDVCSTQYAMNFTDVTYLIAHVVRFVEYHELSYFIPSSRLSSLYRPPIA